MEKKRMMICLVAAVMCVAFMVGCASEPKPTANIANANLQVERARQVDAIRYAPLELKLAEDKLNEAKSASEDEDYKKARLFADEAFAQARVAEAKSRSVRTANMAQQMQQTVADLQRTLIDQQPGTR